MHRDRKQIWSPQDWQLKTYLVTTWFMIENEFDRHKIGDQKISITNFRSPKSTIKNFQSPTFNCHYQQSIFLLCLKNNLASIRKKFNHSIKSGNSSNDWKKIQVVLELFKSLLENFGHQFSISDFGDWKWRPHFSVCPKILDCPKLF
jgi:hypothetical protein